MRAFFAEIERAFRLTYEGFLEVRGTGRSHSGWLTDPHLRKGFVAAIPVVLGGIVIAVLLMAKMRSFVPYVTIFMPATIFANIVWFAVAARSRAKG